MSRPSVIGLLPLLAAPAWCQQPPNSGDTTSPLARVYVVVTDTFGMPAGKVLAILSAGSNEHYRRYEQSGEGIDFQRVPFGDYDLEISAAGFAKRHERVSIYNSEVRLWFGLAVAVLEGTGLAQVEGSILSPGRAQDGMWVRLVSLYSSDFIEDRVAPSGVFRLNMVHPGRYVLLLFDKSGLLATRQVDLPAGRSPLTVELPRL
jgi:hypothetical protein